MKVLYDISVLGLGQKDQSARTGVFRVVESVAEQLINKSECFIHFCSNHDLLMLKYSVEYWKQQDGFSNVPFSKPLFLYEIAQARTHRFELINFILKSDLPINKKIPIKAQIRALWMKEVFYGLFCKDDSLIKKKDLLNADIYHSPFLAIPDEIYQKGFKSVFLTIYDLIPLLYPQFCGESIKNVLSSIVKSINRDTWVLCISEATRNDLLNYMGNSVDPNKVFVTELAASDKFYPSTDDKLNKKVKEKYKIPDSPYILSLCTLEPRKNIDHVIKAFVKILREEKIADLNLVLVGAKGWMFDDIFNEIEASSEFKDRIFITGFVDDEDLAPIYTGALMFIYTSFYEGFGLPPLEAMQCGIPVITSNNSSLPEVVGDAGIMVNSTDLDGLCQHILNIYSNPSLREMMVEKSLLRARLFSWERCAEKTVRAYKNSLSL